MNRMISLVCLLLFFISAKADKLPAKPVVSGGIIKGIVIDKDLEVPVEYATVSVYTMPDSTLIGGTITNSKGFFELKKIKSGTYYVEVSFIGYNKTLVRNIPITKSKKVADLKKVKIRQSAESLDEVVVTSERLPVQYRIDKKVIPVSRQITAASGTAVDVLDNVPSVSVDIEGNVSLRGSSNFTVLVDGKPSILDASDILEQMPASVIENIEIITNPSAKYDPEGTAGIINIVTKKGKLKGLSGVANLNLGTQENYGADFLINYRKKKWNWNFGVDYNNRVFKGTQTNKNRTFVNDITNFVLSEGDSEMKRLSYGIRAGFDLDLDSLNQFSLNVRYGKRDMQRKANLDYQEYYDPETSIKKYDSYNSWDREMNFLNTNFSYTRKFSGKGHQWITQVMFATRDGDEQSINRLVDNSGKQFSGQITTDNGPGSRWEIRSDYTLPLANDGKFEAGYQGQIRSSESETEFFDYDPALQKYLSQDLYKNTVNYDQQVHGLYALYAQTLGKFGYQLGVRSEYTGREIQYKGKTEKFTIDTWDFFPTIHTQMDLGSDNQIMASYTRRIQRPRSWYLEPFITWTDAYNVRQGNPDLDPEYIDSYELGYMKRFGDQAISIESYYRVTHNKIERIRSVYQENIMLSSFANVGKDYALGVETMFNLTFVRWLKNDLIGNFYHYKEEGDFTTVNSAGEKQVRDFSTESFNWKIRNNTSFIFDKQTRLQINLNYNSPTDWAQGKREGFFIISAALKREFFKRKLSATFQVRDVFSTAKHQTEYSGTNFYNYSEFKRKSPSFHLNLSFKINNYQKKRARSENGGDTEEFEM